MESIQNYLLEALRRLEKFQKEKAEQKAVSSIEQKSVQFLRELIQEQVQNENTRTAARSIR